MPRKHEHPVTICPTTEGDAGLQVETVLSRSKRGRRRAIEATPRVEPLGPRVPRITRLMALAIKFQDMMDRGEVRDYADIARLGYVSRARLTQIMNLSLLAPRIQERLLGGDLPDWPSMTERDLRSVAARVYWAEQVAVLEELRCATPNRHAS